MAIKSLVLAGAAFLAAVPISPHVVLAQGSTYVAPDQGQGQSGDEQTPPDMKKQRRHGQTGDDQSSGDMKKRHTDGQSDGQSPEMQNDRNNRKEAMGHDRHGQWMRHREGRFRYFHDGYYYASPWWGAGVGIGVDGGGIGCNEGARIVSRRGFNRVVPIDCGGDFYTYRGWRGGGPWRIRVNSGSGQIVATRPLG